MIAWRLCFKHNTLYETEKQFRPLSVNELKYTEGAVLWLVQEKAFSSLEDSRICMLCPCRDEAGFIRVKTRLTERDYEYAFTTPVVLPQDHPVVKCLVCQYHIKIVKGRQLTLSIVKNCTVCRRYVCNSFDVVSPPLLPSRVNDTSVFEVGSIDYSGLPIIRGGKKIVTSLSTNTFLLALWKFIARRGRPSVIYSDNATCFQGRENALETLDCDEIQVYCSIQRIQWRYNPPAASWWGGLYERMVQTCVLPLEVDMGPAEPGVDETEDNKGGVAQVSDSPNCPATITYDELRQTQCGRLIQVPYRLNL
ncbi:hypothetical protein PR048_005842 [Dryococelus australis]|uniref:Integrase catalytic domain-containing protein n=1 Tax=Dryococelus australis TaxID=614101 RepID=A0ABQ9I9E5_9NEOP|nr:hypothetical protein PR048_005842 [Dryococelus australis]